MMNQNPPASSHPAPPPPPPRAPTGTPGGTLRRPPPTPSAFVDTTPAEHRPDQWNKAALDYDHEFEKRFRFNPIENLPPPGVWHPASQSKSTKPIDH